MACKSTKEIIKLLCERGIVSDLTINTSNTNEQLDKIHGAHIMAAIYGSADRHSIDFPWCFVRKFSGSQLRATSYKVKLSECYATSPSVIVADHSGPPASQDQDDEPSPVTPAVPAASVSPESPPPAPPELTSVPPDEEQFPSSTFDDLTLAAHIGVQPLPVLQEESSTSVTAPDQALPSCPSSPPETPGPRPQRQRKPPSYLNDYVRF